MIRANLTFIGEPWCDSTTMPDFGRFVKEMRTRKGMSLREFCRLANLDPGNWSKVERGKFPPPKSREVVSDNWFDLLPGVPLRVRTATGASVASLNFSAL